MKQFLAIILICVVIMALVGCGAVIIEPEEDTEPVTYGKSVMVEIGEGLWYDSSTTIVYWWNGHMGLSDYSTTPSPYYAPNGLPYRYNPETNEFEEIER